MKKTLIALAALVGLTLMTVQPVAAESVDMASVTCKDLSSTEDATVMLLWLDGYISAKSGDTTIDDAWMEELGSALATECEKYPDDRVLAIVQRMNYW